MAALSAFHPYIIPIAPGIPEFAVDRALVDSAIQFCRDTWVWQEELDPIEVLPGAGELDLYPAARANVISVIYATIDGEPMYPSDAGDENRLAYFHDQPNRLIVSPELKGTFSARAVLEPRNGDTSLADSLFTEWRETLGAGAASRLYLMIGDAERASFHSRIFHDGLSRARAHKATTRSKRRIRTVPVR